MKINDLYEARKNPDLNVKESFYDFLLKYADDPSMFLHTTDVEKVGINPKTAKKSGHDTPAGIFTFQISALKKRIEMAKEQKLSPALFLDYYGGDHAFVLQSNESFVDTLKSYTDDDLKKDVKKLKEIYDDELVDQSLSIAHTNENYVDSPIGKLWGMTKAIAIGGTSELSHQQYPDAMKWNTILRKIGHKSFHDTGHGWIHGYEGAQSLFLTTKAFTVVDHMVIKRKQKEIKIGGQEYKGGRLPKVLTLDKIDELELMNIDRDNPEISKVKEINVGKTNSIHDLTRLSGVFKNAKINVNYFLIKKVDDLSKLSGSVNVDNLLIAEFPMLPTEIKKLEQYHHLVNNVLYTDQTISRMGRVEKPNPEKYSHELFSKINELN